MKKYIFAVALMLPMAGPSAFAQTVPCGSDQANMNTQCGQSGNKKMCENAIRQFAVCLSAIGGGVPQCQQQAQQSNKNCYTPSAPPAQVCPGELNQLASCIEATLSTNPNANPNPNPGVTVSNPQTDYHYASKTGSKPQSDYRLSCPYFVNDGSAKGTTAPNEMQTIQNCRDLMKTPSPLPY